MSRLQANSLLLLAALFWGLGNVAQKTAMDDLGPMLTLGLRCLIGAAAIAPLVVREARRGPPLAPGSLGGAALAGVAFCGALMAQQLAYADTSVTNAGFLVSTTVVFTPFLGWLILKERPRRLTWPAVAMILGGVLLMGGGLDGLRAGDGYGLAAALLFSVWMVLVTCVVRRNARPFAIAAVQFALAALLPLGLGLWREPLRADALMGAAPELVVLGVLSTAGGFTLQVIAQRAAKVADAAIITSAESLFGALAAAVLLGERATPAGQAGALLILSAVLLVQLVPPGAGRPREAAPALPAPPPAPPATPHRL